MRQTVIEEALGDLKLYRVAERTTVASRESKQVRLLDRSAIPISIIYRAAVAGETPAGPRPADAAPTQRLLRTRNTQINHLGVPLPSGEISVFGLHGGEPVLEQESGLTDLAVGEEVEIEAGPSADGRYHVMRDRVRVDSPAAGQVPLSSGWQLRRIGPALGELDRVEITNARAEPSEVELRLELAPGEEVVRADHTLHRRQGIPTFHLKIPAQSTAILRYQTRRST